MIIVRHAEECAGNPDTAGRLTGKCNCKTAKLDQTAPTQLERLLGKLASDSIRVGEESEYFALRLDALSDQIAQDARGVRRTAKRALDIHDALERDAGAALHGDRGAGGDRQGHARIDRRGDLDAHRARPRRVRRDVTGKTVTAAVGAIAAATTTTTTTAAIADYADRNVRLSMRHKAKKARS